MLPAPGSFSLRDAEVQVHTPMELEAEPEPEPEPTPAPNLGPLTTEITPEVTVSVRALSSLSPRKTKMDEVTLIRALSIYGGGLSKKGNLEVEAVGKDRSNDKAESKWRLGCKSCGIPERSRCQKMRVED